MTSASDGLAKAGALSQDNSLVLVSDQKEDPNVHISKHSHLIAVPTISKNETRSSVSMHNFTNNVVEEPRDKEKQFPIVHQVQRQNSSNAIVTNHNTAHVIKNLDKMWKAGQQVYHIEAKVPGSCREQDRRIQQVVVVNPGEDTDQSVSEAVVDITRKLSDDAAERLAQGHASTDKETTIEITRISNPADSRPTKDSGPFGNAKCSTNNRRAQSYYANRENIGPPAIMTRSHVNKFKPRPYRRRKSPLRHRSVDNCHVTEPSKVLPGPANSHAIRARQAIFRNSLSCIPTTAICNLGLRPAVSNSPATDITAAMRLKMKHSGSVRVAQNPPTQPCSVPMYMSDHMLPCDTVTTIVHPPGSFVPVLPPVSNTKRPVAILNRSRSNSSYKSYVMGPMLPPVTVANTTITLSDTLSSLDSVGNNTHEVIDGGEISDDGSLMNESLTNIQWLGSMKGDNLRVVSHKDIRLVASEKQIEKVNQECGRQKRPPYSYMHLIQMAICSTPDRRMTLKEIYTWIELKFPYYRYNDNKGWRNSIRHNLSLYNIFKREKSAKDDGRMSSSTWTLRGDYKQQPLPLMNDDNSTVVLDDTSDSVFMSDTTFSPTVAAVTNAAPAATETLSQAPFVDALSNNYQRSSATSTLVTSAPSNGVGHIQLSKKKPVPLLPKPTAASPQLVPYAIIPIQGGVPVVPPTPVFMPADWSPDVNPSLLDTSSSRCLKRGASPASMTSSTLSASSSRKQIRIAPKPSLTMPSSAGVYTQSQLMPSRGAVASRSQQNPHSQTMCVNTDVNYSEASALHVTVSSNGDVIHTGPFQQQTNTSTGQQHQRHADSGLGGSFASDNSSSQEIAVYDVTSPLQQQQQQHQQSFPVAATSSPPPMALPLSGLSTPELYIDIAGTPLDGEAEHVHDIKTNLDLLNETTETESGIEDVIRCIENDVNFMTSDNHQLLQTTPPKVSVAAATSAATGGASATSRDVTMLTSTPVKSELDESPNWISPIRGFVSSESWLFSPSVVTTTVSATDAPPVAASTPRDQLTSIAVKSERAYHAATDGDDATSEQQRTPPPSSTKYMMLQRQTSPRLGSLSDLGLHGLTPMKVSPKSAMAVNLSPTLHSQDQSFGKLLGELQLEGIIDEGISLDVSNISFSHFNTDQ